MEHSKAEGELQQEQSDELFARQLQEQLENPDTVTNDAFPDSGETRSAQEAADAALAHQLQEELNQQESAAAAHLPGEGSDQRALVKCPFCSSNNHIEKSSSSKHWRCKQCHQPLRDDALPSSHTAEKNLVECKVCRSLNRLPSTKSDAVLCGGCYQQLGSILSTAPPAVNEENQRTVQLRCGQCNVINAVTVGIDVVKIEFICGGCDVLNTMVLE
ncbi:hypothetical protein JKF63_04406 [Porcisia hertigi]|uniref:Uncharacterized protein n=1 Tax=Porcisia hertigi TaxID=2761500 RepID=A0A836I4M3_9TRYP|nr:hypothetical protein JKF63_04406 [Porcisia hertigi]